jgi:hypothetical protein
MNKHIQSAHGGQKRALTTLQEIEEEKKRPRPSQPLTDHDRRITAGSNAINFRFLCEDIVRFFNTYNDQDYKLRLIKKLRDSATDLFPDLIQTDMPPMPNNVRRNNLD